MRRKRPNNKRQLAGQNLTLMNSDDIYSGPVDA